MKHLALLFLFCVFGFISFSQKITYTAPLQKISKNSFYDIIGKVKDDYLLLAAQNNEYFVNVFNNSLELIKNEPLSFLPKGDARNIRTVFITYPDNVKMIYSYQKNRMVYCVGVALDENAIPLEKPMVIDSAKMRVAENGDIYSVIKSEDKSKIMILKVQKNTSNDEITISTKLFNEQLRLLNKSMFNTSYDPKFDSFDNFSLSNNGDLVFTENKTSNTEVYPGSYILASSLIVNPSSSEIFNVYPMSLSGQLLTGLYLKIDNLHNRVILNSFFSPKINVEGILTSVFDFINNKYSFTKLTQLGAGIRSLAKSEPGTASNAFNNYVISDVVLRKSGDFIVTAEDVKTDYTSHPVFSKMDEISPSSLLYYNYEKLYLHSFNYSWTSLWNKMIGANYNSNYSESAKSYTFGNILAIEIDNTGNLQWGNVIHKNQYEMDKGIDPLSFSIMKNSSHLFFLYNKPDKEKWALNSEIINSTGELIKNPPLAGSENDHLFLPHFAKQISENTILIPTLIKGRYCLSKVEIS